MSRAKVSKQSMPDFAGDRLREFDLPQELAALCGLSNIDIATINPARAAKDPGKGIFIPYQFHTDGSPWEGMYRFRYCERPPGFGDQVKKQAKYVQTSDLSSAVYAPPLLTNLQLLKEPQGLGMIGEGEFKGIMVADTIASAIELGMDFPFGAIPWVIALGGVSSWRGKGGALLADLENILVPGSIILIAFDNDNPLNPNVVIEERKLAQAIMERKCTPLRCTWKNKKGIDDYLAQYPRGVARIIALYEIFKLSTTFSAYAKVLELNEQFVYIDRVQKIMDFRRSIQIAPAEFRNSYCPGKIIIPKDMDQYIRGLNGDKLPPVKEEKIASLWLDSPIRRQVDRLEFQPGQPRVVGDTFCNTWLGYGLSAETDRPLMPEKGDVKPLLDYLKAVLKNHTSQEQEWLIQRIAWTFQHPLEKADSWVNIKGVPQCGKTGFVDLLAAIVGNLYTARPDGAALTGNHNYFMNKTMLISLDDTNLNKEKRDEILHQFKRLVSETTHDINEKFEKQYRSKSCPLWIWTGNRYCPIEPDDRKSAVFEFVPPDWTLERWKLWDIWRENLANQAALLYFFLNYSLESFNPKEAAPRTVARDLAIEESLKGAAERALYNIQRNEGIVQLQFRNAKNEVDVKEIELTLFTAEDLLAVLQKKNLGVQNTANTLGAMLGQYGFRKWGDGKLIRTIGRENAVRLWAGPTKRIKELESLPIKEAKRVHEEFRRACSGAVDIPELGEERDTSERKKYRSNPTIIKKRKLK